MKTSNLKSLLFLALMIVGLGMNAQSTLWEKVSPSETQNRSTELRNSTPEKFDLFKLNTTALKNLLAQAPERFTTTSNIVIDLPTNNGELQSFRVYEAPTLAPELQAKYPSIRSYAAQGIDDATAIARFSVSDIGVNVSITSANYSTLYIDPYTQDKNFYIAYNLSDLPTSNNFECLVEESMAPELPVDVNRNANDGKLRTYRLALACTRQYANFHLTRQGVDNNATDAVKKAAVLSAMNVTMTRVNGIYERDVAVTMVIVPNSDELIFLTAATDPYTNNNGFTMLSQNQTQCDQKIGNANYDIGHVFSTGGGGIAGLRVPCVTGQKARGVTGLGSPIGDKFNIDFVAHEMGHQFGANHTFNGTTGGCGGGNRNLSTAMEPGSGSTIMAYAGLCGSQNVQYNSDAYFHAISIQEIWSNIKYGNSSSCAVLTDTGNTQPTADAGSNYTIPKSTPFVLTGVGTDADGDTLSHCWEQMNSQHSTQPPVPTSTGGPTFRTNMPESTPERYFPKMSYVLAGNLGGPGTSNKWEVVPSVGRALNFKYTVRDNHAGGGSTASSNMKVTVDGTSGPFVVTSQASATTWQTTTTETITWDVAGTDAAPVSCATVDILFSTDSGFNYPVTLALNVPNTGSAVVNVPNLNTTTGRLMVKGSDNVFFNVNQAVISVQGVVGVSDFSFEDFSVYPNPSNGTFNLKFTPASADDIEVSLFDLRGRMVNQVVYSDASTGLFNKQLDYNYIDSGMYFLVVKNGDKSVTKKLVKK
jgi:hypothetical protein